MDRFYVFELFGLDGPCTVKARSCGELLAKLLDTLAARLAEMPPGSLVSTDVRARRVPPFARSLFLGSVSYDGSEGRAERIDGWVGRVMTARFRLLDSPDC